MKSCTVCHKELPLTEFHRDSRIKLGHRAQCKRCVISANTIYQRSVPDKTRAKRQKYEKTAKGKITHYNKYTRRHAAKLNLPKVDYDPVSIYEREGGVCSLCGELVEKFKETKEGTVRAFHIDHVVPLQVDTQLLLSYGIEEHPGDVPWNVTIAHPSCNSSKGNRMTQDDADNYFQLCAMYKE